MNIRICVPAVPIAQPRPRARAMVGGDGTTRATVYQPKKHPSTEFKSTVRMAAQKVYTGPPLTGALRVDCEFVFPRTRAQIWKRKPMPRMHHVKKPDRDNLDKAVCDALTGLLWVDDCQVCDGRVQKWIASGDEQPHVTITVTPIIEFVQTEN